MARIDDFLPSFQFREFHETRVRATAAEIFAAIWAVTAREILFFRTVTWIRSPRLRRRREDILCAPPDKPLLTIALDSTFELLAEDPDREIVVGIRVARGVRAAMNFHVEPAADGWCTVTTETRVFAATETARRRFAWYWRTIYPGSALIRRMWLRAIKRRAERCP